MPLRTERVGDVSTPVDMTKDPRQFAQHFTCTKTWEKNRKHQARVDLIVTSRACDGARRFGKGTLASADKLFGNFAEDHAGIYAAEAE